MTTTERREMSGAYETVVTQVTVKPTGKTIFDLGVSHVKIDDEGGGMFVTVRQESDTSRREIQIDPLEWEPLKAAVDRMVCEIIAMELAENPLNVANDAEEAEYRWDRYVEESPLRNMRALAVRVPRLPKRISRKSSPDPLTSE